MRSSRYRQIIILLVVAVLSSACAKKGPAQKAGEKVDRAADKVSDTLDPKGPVEKAGRAVDRATGN
jgi:hypothetical protein